MSCKTELSKINLVLSRKSLVMQDKHSFLITLWEIFSVIVNSVLLVEMKFAFTFGQETYEKKLYQ